MSVSKHRKRARDTQRERRATFDRLHGEVLKGRTVRDLWLTYAKARFKDRVEEALADPMIDATIMHAFYGGAAAMLELMTRVSPDDVSEDVGVEMLNRLYEELMTFSGGLR